MESGVYQSRRPVRPYVCYPHGYQARIQSSLKVQDGISFFFKMESAWPVPFLPHYLTLSSISTKYTNLEDLF